MLYLFQLYVYFISNSNDTILTNTREAYQMHIEGLEKTVKIV